MAIGAPTCKIRPAVLTSSRSSRSEKRRSVYFRCIYAKPMTQEAICEMTVAIAAPTTPIPSPATNARSSATFRIDETSRKYSVALLSPSARRRAAAMLYPNWNTSPAA